MVADRLSGVRRQPDARLPFRRRLLEPFGYLEVSGSGLIYDLSFQFN